jgi:hypothetical protein
MIEARSHLVHHTRSRIRVLRLAVIDGRVAMHRYIARRGPGTCERCGCTDAYSCFGGCGWVNATHTLCSRCYERMLT